MGNETSNASGSDNDGVTDDDGVSYVGDDNGEENAATAPDENGKTHADKEGKGISSRTAKLDRSKTQRRRSIQQAVQVVDAFNRKASTGSKHITVESTDSRDLSSADDNKSRGSSTTKKSASDGSKKEDANFIGEISFTEVEDNTSVKAEIKPTSTAIRRTVSQPTDYNGRTTDIGTNKMAIRRVESTGTTGLHKSYTLGKYRRQESVAGVHKNGAVDLHNESAEGTNNSLDGDNEVGPLSSSLLDDVTRAAEQPIEAESRPQTDENYLLQENIFRPILKSFSQVCVNEGKQ